MKPAKMVRLAVLMVFMVTMSITMTGCAAGPFIGALISALGGALGQTIGGPVGEVISTGANALGGFVSSKMSKPAETNATGNSSTGGGKAVSPAQSGATFSPSDETGRQSPAGGGAAQAVVGGVSDEQRAAQERVPEERARMELLRGTGEATSAPVKKSGNPVRQGKSFVAPDRLSIYARVDEPSVDFGKPLLEELVGAAKPANVAEAAKMGQAAVEKMTATLLREYFGAAGGKR